MGGRGAHGGDGAGGQDPGGGAAGAVVALRAGVAGGARIGAIRTIGAKQFKRVCTVHQPGGCGIEDLHWHDARATAITRLARRLDILDLARMIGHANLGELRTYYRERAEDIAARL